MQVAWCHLPDVYNFEMAAGSLENLWTPAT